MVPPPPEVIALETEGAALTGAPAMFLGLYQRAGKCNGVPAWRHVVLHDLWITRGSNGVWVAQRNDVLGTNRGGIRLIDSACLYPTLNTRTWEASTAEGEWRCRRFHQTLVSFPTTLCVRSRTT